MVAIFRVVLPGIAVFDNTSNSSDERAAGLGPKQVLVTPASTPAQMTSPVAGSTLTTGTAGFQWSAGTAVSAYWLYVGSSAGASNYQNSGNLGGSALTRTVSGLPTNGSTIYVRLYSSIGGAWQYTDYTYTAYYSSNSGGGSLIINGAGTVSGGSSTITGSLSGMVSGGNLTIGNGTFSGGTITFGNGTLGNGTVSGGNLTLTRSH